MQTKMSILEQRRHQARVNLRKAQDTLEEIHSTILGLYKTTCGLNCSGCGEFLATEADFAEHFYIVNSAYLNLGECPVKDGIKR